MFTTTYSIWLLSEILLNRLLRSKLEDKQNSDRNSLPLIWMTIVLCITTSVVVSVKTDLRFGDTTTISYIGLAIIWIGMIARLLVIKTLGQFFTVDVTIRQNHKLKTDGFYNFLRHPSYFSSLISFMGFGISRNNWLSLLVVFVPVLIIFVVRIVIEERVLIDKFGDEYLAYRKRTYALIPFIF